ncbi:hypothetical protein MYSTI_02153 [Myxococcus stipitatus DSM 14675]|uniref:Uncharacterized protein n=1 Tax=Myxococcus stipitatus (strain DSM 14675 / JCM 12634 / Mx s8) TaxID=1278073 RepID=L7U6M7_MYXSD|nr:hypothetical protein [Myxococcus stipitatus]AGC43480.1 hypothetical protein MYSTI_02153 [Myxococcus stipitatus DSM 14675]
MSDSPLKPRETSPSVAVEPPPAERRRGRVLLAATAASAAFTMVACEPYMTTNPAPCLYDGGLTVGDCDPDAAQDGGPDAGLPQVP